MEFRICFCKFKPISEPSEPLVVVASWGNLNEKGHFAAADLVAGAGFEPPTFGL
jgi:hypothetical protein